MAIPNNFGEEPFRLVVPIYIVPESDSKIAGGKPPDRTL